MRLYYLLYENKKQELARNASYLIGRGEECDIRLSDVTVSRRHARLSGGPGGFRIEDLESTNGTWLDGQRITTQSVAPGQGFRLGSCNLRLVARDTVPADQDGSPADTMIFEQHISEILAEVEGTDLAPRVQALKQFYNAKREDLARMAFRDQLTGLFNRRYFDRRLDDEWDRSVRYQRPLSVVMIDIDHFKKYNDTWGHQKGDEVLAAVARILAATCRTSDVLCRYGGEEMVFILPETPGEKACVMAELCRQRVAGNTEPVAGCAVTVSLGVAERLSNMPDSASLLKAADANLYKAKEAGRNRIQF